MTEFAFSDNRNLVVLKQGLGERVPVYFTKILWQFFLKTTLELFFKPRNVEWVFLKISRRYNQSNKFKIKMETDSTRFLSFFCFCLFVSLFAFAFFATYSLVSNTFILFFSCITWKDCFILKLAIQKYC